MELLSLFLGRPDESFYLREVVRRTGCGTGAVQRELAQLAACGILTRDHHRFFAANTKSPLFAPLQQLVLRTAGLADRLRLAIDPVAPRIAFGFIFGSFAQGNQHRSSDIDLMIVARDEALDVVEVSPMLSTAQQALGREINPFVLPLSAFRSRARRRDHFLTRVLAGPKIFLIGEEDELERVASQRMAEAAGAPRGRNRRSSRARGAGS